MTYLEPARYHLPIITDSLHLKERIFLQQKCLQERPLDNHGRNNALQTLLSKKPQQNALKYSNTA